MTWKRFRDACDTFFTRRNADLAQRKETWAANQAKKEALCARAEELAASTRVGSRRRRDPPASGRVEDHRPGPPQQVRGDLEAVPHRVRHLLRPLQAPRRDRARDQTGGSRSAGRRARSAVRPRQPPEGSGEAGRRRAGRPPRARPIAAHALEPMHAGRPSGRRSAQRAVRRCARTADRRLSGRVPWNRARRRRQPTEDGEAVRKVEGFLSDAAAKPANSSQALADDAARSAGGEHDRRTRG